MKKFLFSMALALGAICMPSQASAAEVSSPVVRSEERRVGKEC